MRALGTTPAEARPRGIAIAPDPRSPFAPAGEAPADGEILNDREVAGLSGMPDAPVRAPEPERSTWFEAGPAPRWGRATGPEPAGGPVTGPDTGPVTGPVPGVPWSVTVPAQETDEDLDGLPMRIPQVNMAPQLRTNRRVEPRAVSVRSPEELAELMSSMQRGWQQGRRQAEQGQDAQNRKDDHPDVRPQN
jgi:hypothetical protein